MKQEVYQIEGMHCAACSAAVERVTKKLDGAVESGVNLTTGRLTIIYDETKLAQADIIAAVDKAGFHAIPPEPASSAGSPNDGARSLRERGESDARTDALARRRITAALILSAILLTLSMGPMLMRGMRLPTFIDLRTHPVNYALTQLLLTIVILYFGRRFFVSGFRALWHRNPNMDSLVAIGSTVAFAYSLVITYLLTDNAHLVHELYYESAAVVVTLVSLGKYLEQRSTRKTTGAIQKLMELAPDRAVLLALDGTQREVETASLAVGDTVLVKPGSRVPLDGTVTRGESGVDESMLTGESMPVEKGPGSEVIGGSINGNGALTVRITRVGADTTLSRIIRFVEDAQGKKAPISKVADRVAGVFVPTVIGIAVLAGVIWLLSGKELSFALRVFTSVLVIACPCAMGLATPTAIVVGTGLGAQHGILIRSGEALEITHSADTVVLDKTGTVTQGKPCVTQIVPVGMEQDALLGLAALVESASAHPLAGAVVARAKEDGVQSPLTVSTFTNLSGRGVQARLSDGRSALIGNARLMEENGVNTEPLAQRAAALAGEGHTTMLIALDGALCGLIAVADPVKETSVAAIKRLREMGLKTILLTGDNRAAAEHVGKLVGVDEVVAQVLPEEKADAIARLQRQGRRVIMVGDGINDAPALTQADVGCAVGGGSDVAIESADIVLMRDDLSDVPRAIRLSRLTLRNIRQNLFWAFCYNTVGIPIAAGALYPAFGLLLNPMLAGLAMSLSSVCVVGNALRLRGKRL